MMQMIFQHAYYALALSACLTSHSATAKPINTPQTESNDLQTGFSKVIQGRQAQPPASSAGIHVSLGSCSAQDQTTLETAILDASYLAGAALNAGANFTNVPFSSFFKGNATTAETVSSVYRNIQIIQQGSGPYILASCKDTAKLCSKGTAAYTAQNRDSQNVPPIIVFCPTALALPRNPTPCTQPPGAISLGSLMLHEMSRVHTVSEAGGVTGETAQEVADALFKGKDTTTDAQAYALLGSFAWDLGLGGPPWNQQTTCLNEFYSAGQSDSKGLETVDVASASID